MSNGENRRILSEVALGNIPPDTIVINGGLFKVFTREFVIRGIRGESIYAIGNEIVSEFPALLWGFYSLKPMEILGADVKNLDECLKGNGVKWEKPILTIDTLGTPAIPHLRITHQGYVNLKDRKILSLEG